MFDFSEVTLRNIIIHKVGTNQEDETLLLSEKPLVINDEDMQQVLIDFFLRPFKPDAFFRFAPVESLETHEMYQHISTIFNDKPSFEGKSKHIARRLHHNSNHPNIKTGEFYVVHFAGCVVDDEITDAIGLFKSENKDTFLKVIQTDDNYQLNMDTGINIKKLDKGCLIFNTDSENGYKISIVDKTNKTQEAHYWIDDFLQVEYRPDEFYDTSNYIELCKSFSDDILTEENNIEKPEQLAFLKRSQEYFENHEKFDENQFKDDVIVSPEVAGAFKDYKKEFEDQWNVPTNNNFDISKPAIKKQKKYFRPVIKLDKNFHLYVHGKPDFMTKGFDEQRQMKYYQLFFYEES